VAKNTRPTLITPMQSRLGPSVDTADGQILFEEPLLPRSLDEVILRRLALGDGGIAVNPLRAGPRSSSISSNARQCADIHIELKSSAWTFLLYRSRLKLSRHLAARHKRAHTTLLAAIKTY
jgi:hypothetical protein